jgi:hypothetical protein
MLETAKDSSYKNSNTGRTNTTAVLKVTPATQLALVMEIQMEQSGNSSKRCGTEQIIVHLKLFVSYSPFLQDRRQMPIFTGLGAGGILLP